MTEKTDQLKSFEPVDREELQGLPIEQECVLCRQIKPHTEFRLEWGSSRGKPKLRKNCKSCSDVVKSQKSIDAVRGEAVRHLDIGDRVISQRLLELSIQNEKFELDAILKKFITCVKNSEDPQMFKLYFQTIQGPTPIVHARSVQPQAVANTEPAQESAPEEFDLQKILNDINPKPTGD